MLVKKLATSLSIQRLAVSSYASQTVQNWKHGGNRHAMLARKILGRQHNPHQQIIRAFVNG